MNWLRNWRINRIRERIAALSGMIPLYQTLAKQCATCYYDELAIDAAGELESLKVRLAQLESKQTAASLQ